MLRLTTRSNKGSRDVSHVGCKSLPTRFLILSMKIKELREKTGLSQSKFAEKFHINVRTLQGWEMERSKTPDYVVFMVGRILELEEKLDDK